MGLVHNEQIGLPLLISKLTAAPTTIINKELGTLKDGSSADITIINTNKEWRVETRKFLSKGRNTPLEGKILKGKVAVTICDGKIVYEDED